MKKRQIPQHLKDLIHVVGMTEQEATWDCHGTPVIYHDALERIAEHQGIMFDKPTIIETIAEKGIVAMLVQGTNGDKTAWSIGEASPHNSKNSYPFAMSEKRAKDRVILKLIGASGFVYSEEEADSFQNPNRFTNQPEPQPEPEVEEPIEDGPSIIRDTKTEDQQRELDTFELKVYQCGYHIDKFVTIQDANAWHTKNKAFLAQIKEKYSIDHKIIQKMFRDKWTEITSKK
tara:strand:+ start:2098 stop:2790 length:693 start_codon:yes stop_codon:yes gene_type:complete